jgi:hypothetical protein
MHLNIFTRHSNAQMTSRTRTRRPKLAEGKCRVRAVVALEIAPLAATAQEANNTRHRLRPRPSKTQQEMAVVPRRNSSLGPACGPEPAGCTASGNNTHTHTSDSDSSQATKPTLP